MLTLHSRVASIPVVATSRVRVQVAAPPKRLFARFLSALVRALGAMHT